MYTLEHGSMKELTLGELKERVKFPDDERIFAIAELIRRGYREDMLCNITGVDSFFVRKLKNIIDKEEEVKKLTIKDVNHNPLRSLKKMGFSDKGIGSLMGKAPM